MRSRTASLPSSRSSSKALLLLLAAALVSPTGYARTQQSRRQSVYVPRYQESQGQAYALLERKADDISSKNHVNGWAYVASGIITLGVSLPMYYLSEDIFARTVYSLGQTVGVLAIGYGSYLVYVDDDYTRFHRIIRNSSLSAAQRDELSRSFLLENAERARNTRKIRVITHGLTAGLNFTSAVTASQQELKMALYFLGGINALAAISFSVTKSEEEKLYGELHASKAPWGSGLSVAAGPLGAGVTLSF